MGDLRGRFSLGLEIALRRLYALSKVHGLGKNLKRPVVGAPCWAVYGVIRVLWSTFVHLASIAACSPMRYTECHLYFVDRRGNVGSSSFGILAFRRRCSLSEPVSLFFPVSSAQQQMRTISYHSGVSGSYFGLGPRNFKILAFNADE